MRHGFSLVELSIVLVILGLLVGGVLTGQSLIRAAELRSVSTEFSKYQAAVNTFRDKYFALPGDMRNATSFWGASDGTTGITVACKTTAAVGALTCNGDGNGLIESTVTYSQEWYRAWQHLANAGLVEGSYTGVSGAAHATLDTNFGTNAPRSKIANAGFVLQIASYSGASLLSPFTLNQLVFGISGSASEDGDLGAIKAEDAWNIDTKMDDGLPGRGKLRTFTNTYRPNCASTDDPATATYQLTNTTTDACSLIVDGGF